MDDVLMFRKGEKEHNNWLAVILTRTETAGVTINLSKCEFRKNHLKFLGNLINQQGIQADLDKL